jgi:hypothetical protein
MMDIAATFDAFQKELVPDKRVKLCEVSFGGGGVMGLADKSLQGALESFARDHRIGFKVHFAEPGHQFVTSSHAFLRLQPDAKAEVASEAIYGEALLVFDKQGSFCRVARACDHYLGWMNVADMSHSIPEPTHRFAAPRGHLFSAPKVSSEKMLELCYGSALRVLHTEGDWVCIEVAKGQKGYVRSILLHPIAPLEPKAKNIMQVALRFLETPYVWGGTTAWGLDCSGLVQSIYSAFGIQLPRDADQQEVLGESLELSKIKAADLIFSPGHVALSLGGSKILHANAHHMRVTIDDFEKTDYAKHLSGQITSIKRIVI